MRQWTGSWLVQVMACRLFGAKLLNEPMLLHCQLHSWERISVKFESEFYHFHSRKCIWKCRPLKWQPFRSEVYEWILWQLLLRWSKYQRSNREEYKYMFQCQITDNIAKTKQIREHINTIYSTPHGQKQYHTFETKKPRDWGQGNTSVTKYWHLSN